MLKLVTPPAEEPITLAEAKLHLRVDLDDDDALISALITAARRLVETELRRSLVTATWELSLWGFHDDERERWYAESLWRHAPRWFLERPTSGSCRITLPNPPLIAVTSVTYVDPAGSARTLDPEAYQVEDGTPGRIYPAYGTSWPSARCQPGAVAIRYTAGYGAAAAVPEPLKAAIKLLVGHLYEHREGAMDPVVGNGPVVLPFGVAALLATEHHGGYA